MRYTNLELWQFIHPLPDFANFVGQDNDLRDRTKENPAYSIDLKKGQWYDHNTGYGGGLFELAKNLNVLPEKEKQFFTANDIWKKSKRNDETVKFYFTQGRSIPENHY